MSDFIDTLLDTIDQRLEELAPVLWEAWEMQVIAASLRDQPRPLAITPPPHKPQRELARKVEIEGGHKPQGDRKARTPAPTVEAARDYAQSLGREFNASDFREHFNISQWTAQRSLRELAMLGMIRRPEGSPHHGPLMAWEFVKPTANGSPKNAPRSSPPPSNRGPAAPVPHTGKPMGPPSKPGQLKKAQAQGKQIKHQPVKGVRA